MPPRLRISLGPVLRNCTATRLHARRSYATAAAAVLQPNESLAPSYPATQPPSHKPAQFERSQLHRAYTSLIRSTPLFVFFQHNNLTAGEWAGIRRELTAALRKIDKQYPDRAPLAESVKLSIIKGGLFEMALKVVDRYYGAVPQEELKHGLSKEAYEVASEGGRHPLRNVLVGPVAILTFPSVSIEHLRTSLTILSPSGVEYKAPTRRANPNYYSLEVQSGLQKLMLLGARFEGSLLDSERLRWAGLIDGGLDGARSQLIHVLQSAGAGLARTLESSGQSLYFTMEGRKSMLEEGDKKEP